MTLIRAKYIFRVDDIAENMNWGNYFLLKGIFSKYNIKPIIGVISDNQDEKLLKHPKPPVDFWGEIRYLQKLGWSIALHGFNHKYVTNDSGIFGINRYSEFAGLPYDVQNKKIQKGSAILREKGIKIDAFMALAHSLDEVTLEALINNDIITVTDGFCLYPYYYKEILFVPQLLSMPRKMPFGIYTWCLHPNNMSPEKMSTIKDFIEVNRENIISFNDARKYATDGYLNKMSGALLKGLLYGFRQIKKRCNTYVS